MMPPGSSQPIGAQGEQWPQSRRSSVNSNRSSNSENGENNGQPRVRDLNKKMKVPLFGLVYKRQMIVNAITLVLIAAYITLVCLV